MNTIGFMKGITFAPFHKRGSLSTETARKNFDHMIEQWEQELDRIEKTVLKYQKPFFFAEAGCMSRKGSGMIRITGKCRENFAWRDDSYEICEKPVQEIIKRFYEHEAGISLM